MNRRELFKLSGAGLIARLLGLPAVQMIKENEPQEPLESEMEARDTWEETIYLSSGVLRILADHSDYHTDDLLPDCGTIVECKSNSAQIVFRSSDMRFTWTYHGYDAETLRRDFELIKAMGEVLA